MGNFFKGVFSDDGVPSFSRSGTALLVLAVVAWVTIIVWRTAMLPDDLISLAAFMSSLYAVNVGGSTVRAFGAKGTGNGASNTAPPAPPKG
jgi:hypothetical protein